MARIPAGLRVVITGTEVYRGLRGRTTHSARSATATVEVALDNPLRVKRGDEIIEYTRVTVKGWQLDPEYETDYPVPCDDNLMIAVFDE